MSLVLDFDDYALEEFGAIVKSFGIDRYGYVVTANVDHLIRYYDDANFRALYGEAMYRLLDSRWLSHVLYLTRGIRLHVCTGSDLTRFIFDSVIQPEDRVILVGGSNAQALKVQRLYGLRNVHHINPKMGFVRDSAAVEECVRAIESLSPFRFCFLAVGSPQQEVLAQQLKARGIACGLALCVGASINFITGEEQRAPRWLQRIGFEWIYRLAKDPHRLAKRYLVRGPRIFRLLPLFKLRPRQIATTIAEK